MMNKKSRIRAKAIIIGLVLIPLNCYWIWSLEVVRYTHPTLVVPFSNVMFILFFATIFSLLLRKLSKRLAFSQGELLVLYVMLSTASSLASIDMLQILISTMGHAFWFATEENEWKELFWRLLPDWLVVRDTKALIGYYEGGENFYELEYLKVWATSLLGWGLFTIVLIFVMLCINVFLRRQWIESERLTYPIIQLPLSMTEQSGSFFSNKLMWIGFFLAAMISLINGINHFYPAIPKIPVKRRSINYLFTEKPWNMMGSARISFYPFVIGIGFLIPLDLLFSAWFFYWLYKFQLMFSGMTGWGSVPGFPFYTNQAFGAILGILLLVFLSARKQIREIFRKILKGVEDKDINKAPLSYKSAFLGFFAGITFLTIFSYRAGMSILIIPIFFTLYFIVAVFITRLRAELGFLVHNLSYVSPQDMIIDFVGTRRIQPSSLTAFALYNFFNRAYRSHPMPHQLEAFKLGQAKNLNNRRIFITILIAAIASLFATFWILLHFYYKKGADSGYFEVWALGLGAGTFRNLRNWIYYPSGTNPLSLIFTFIGFAVASFMMIMRRRFLWWPLHPLGYALARDWGMYNLWSCFFVSWLVKTVILRYGGLKPYRRAIPFFLGLALGDYLVGGLWSILGVAMDTTVYQFFP